MLPHGEAGIVLLTHNTSIGWELAFESKRINVTGMYTCLTIGISATHAQYVLLQPDSVFRYIFFSFPWLHICIYTQTRRGVGGKADAHTKQGT